jgi:hypothetical protein
VPVPVPFLAASKLEEAVFGFTAAQQPPIINHKEENNAKSANSKKNEIMSFKRIT